MTINLKNILIVTSLLALSLPITNRFLYSPKKTIRQDSSELQRPLFLWGYKEVFENQWGEDRELMRVSTHYPLIYSIDIINDYGGDSPDRIRKTFLGKTKEMPFENLPKDKQKKYIKEFQKGVMSLEE